MDLSAVGTPAQWWQVKCDLDRIYDRFLKTLNSWGLWDSAMILSKEGERIYGKAIKRIGTSESVRLARYLDSHEFDVLFMKLIHKRHYRSCRDRVDNLLIIMRSYLKNNQIKFCYIHVHNYGNLHANIKVIAKVIGEDGVMSEKEAVYDPWASLKQTFFTRLFIHHIQQTDLKASPGMFF